METPAGMLTIEQFAKKKGLDVDEAIEKIRSGSYQGRIINSEWFVYDDQVDATEKSPTNQSIKSKNTHYSFARLLENIFIVFGWLGLFVGAIFIIFAVDNNPANKLVAAIPGLVVCFSGLILIAAAQITLAVIDTADNSRHILEELRNRR